MKRCLLSAVLAIVCANAQVLCQSRDDSPWSVNIEDSFNDPHCPFTNSMSMWFLKQSFSIDVYQLLYRSVYSLPGNPDSKPDRLTVEGFLPLLTTDTFGSFGGFTYNYNTISSDRTQLNKPLIDSSRLWLALEYRFPRMKLMTVGELYFMGDNASVYENLGNEYFFIGAAIISLNPEWLLALMGGYKSILMGDGQRDNLLFPGAQLRFEPNEQFKMIFGLPTALALEWRIIPGVDFSYHQLMLDDFDTFLRFYVTNKLSVSIHYQYGAGNSSSIYFPAEVFESSAGTYTFNNITQFSHTVSVKAGFRVQNDVGIVIYGGYAFNGQADVFYNREKLTSVGGVDSFFIGVDLQFLRYR